MPAVSTPFLTSAAASQLFNSPDIYFLTWTRDKKIWTKGPPRDRLFRPRETPSHRGPMHKLVEVFCDVDDFCAVFIPEWEKTLLTDGTRKRQRSGPMTMSEVMTIIIFFQMSHHRDFKNFYTGYLAHFYKSEFPNLLSYTIPSDFLF